MAKYMVYFLDNNGVSLGGIEVYADTKSKAKALAITLFTCSFSSLVVEKI